MSVQISTQISIVIIKMVTCNYTKQAIYSSHLFYANRPAFILSRKVNRNEQEISSFPVSAKASYNEGHRIAVACRGL